MLIEFTLIEKRRIAINPKDVLSVEQGDYLARYNNNYEFEIFLFWVHLIVDLCFILLSIYLLIK